MNTCRGARKHFLYKRAHFNLKIINTGKSPNAWDTFTQQHPHRISDTSNGNVACDSYQKWQEDVNALKNLGVNTYKFSLSWSRLIPNGKMNHEGLNYYNKLIDALIKNNIKPMVVLFHWDTPQYLQDIGG